MAAIVNFKMAAYHHAPHFRILRLTRKSGNMSMIDQWPKFKPSTMLAMYIRYGSKYILLMAAILNFKMAAYQHDPQFQIMRDQNVWKHMRDQWPKFEPSTMPATLDMGQNTFRYRRPFWNSRWQPINMIHNYKNQDVLECLTTWWWFMPQIWTL